MTSFTVGQLEAATDVISIFFFGITALLLIIMTIKYKRISTKQGTTESIVGFKERLAHMINQSGKGNEKNCTSDEQHAGPYKEVGELANLGLDAGEISKNVNIPKSEIELVLSLKKFGLESPMQNRALKIDARVKSPADLTGKNDGAASASEIFRSQSNG